MGKLKITVVIIFLSMVTKAQLCFNNLSNASVISTTLTGAQSLSSADFNNDGIKDLAIPAYSSDNVIILIGTGGGQFTTTTTYPVGDRPISITPNDFNNDGKIDLAVANYGTSNISVLFGSGVGTFSAAGTYSAPLQFFSIISKDFNADGYIDLAGAGGGTNKVGVLLGSSSGTFAAAVTYTVGANAVSVASNDFNNDGMLDLAVSNENSANVSVLLGVGNGNFNAAIDYSVGVNPQSVVSADFNSDGYADLATGNFTSNNISILLATGTGSFHPAVNYFAGKMIQTLTIGDYNQDGNYDLAATNYLSGNISVLLGSSSGVFSPAVHYMSSMGMIGIVSDDFNGDGTTDLAATGTNNYKSNVTILFGSSNGTFGSSNNYYTDDAPVDQALGDFNGDGAVDIAVIHNNPSNSMSVMLNSGNGTFSVVGTYTFVTNTQPSSITTADFNGDGIKDLAVACIGSGSLKIFLGDGMGDFILLTSYANLSSNTVISKDLNNDGVSDLVLSRGTVFNSVGVLLGIGNGQFAACVNYTVGNGARSVVSADYNNDGLSDLALLHSSFFCVLFNLGAGTFSTPVNYPFTVNAWSLVTADFNNDGYNDLAMSENNVASLVNIHLGSPSGVFSSSLTAIPGVGPRELHAADFNNDGNIDIAVSSMDSSCIVILSGLGNGSFVRTNKIEASLEPSGINSADFNGDGDLDFSFTNAHYAISSFNTIILNASSPIIFISSQNLICQGSSVNLVANGVSTYTWNTGSTGSMIYASPNINTTYTVFGTSSGGCSNSAVKTISVATLPSVTINSGTVCSGSSFILSPLGADTYAYSSGTNTVIASTTTNYTVTGTNTLTGCSNTAISTVTVDNTCQDVWPGDANSDGSADNLDVLELGLHYTQTGAPRASVSNAWQSYVATNWVGTITNGKNLNHSDCNGDGTINDNDTLAIYNNYGLTHAFKPEQAAIINPQLSIVPDQAYVTKGNWGTASIYVGDAITSINNINGLAFTVDFDNTLIETNSIYIEYQNSFINTGQNLHFRKLDFANAKIFTATTHTVNNNVSGNGLIAKLHYQIKSNLTTDEVLNIGLSQANQSDAAGTITPLTAGTGTLMAIGASVGMQELNGNGISVSPNPTNGSLTIKSKTELQKIEVVSITGQVLLSETPTNVSHKLHLDNFANGIYFVNLYQNNRIVKRKKVVLNK